MSSERELSDSLRRLLRKLGGGEAKTPSEEMSDLMREEFGRKRGMTKTSGAGNPLLPPEKKPK